MANNLISCKIMLVKKAYFARWELVALPDLDDVV